MKISFDSFVASLSRTSTPLRPTALRRPRPRRRMSGFDRLEERALLSASPLLVSTGAVTIDDDDAAGQDDRTIVSSISVSSQDLAAVTAIDDVRETLAPTIAAATVAPALDVAPVVAAAASVVGSPSSVSVGAGVGTVRAAVELGSGLGSGSASAETSLSGVSSVAVEAGGARDDAAWSDGRLLDILLEVRSDAASAEVWATSAPVVVDSAAGSSGVGAAIAVARDDGRDVGRPGTDVVSPGRDGVPAGETNSGASGGEVNGDGTAAPVSNSPEGEITPDDLARLAFFGQTGQPAPDMMPRELPALVFAAVAGEPMLPSLQADAGPGGAVAPWLGYGVDPTITPNPGGPAEGGAGVIGAVENGAAGAAAARADGLVEEAGGLTASRIAEVFLVAAAVWVARGKSRRRRSAVARLRRVWRRWRPGMW